MKYIALVFALLMLSVSTHASAEIDIELCATIQNVAESVMKARQGDIPLPPVMEMLKETVSSDEPGRFLLLAQAIAVEAYKQPIYPLDEKERVIKYFSNNYVVACYEKLLDDENN